MARKKSRIHPIIYVRGYAMTTAEIADTTATPYMGFNAGSTKIRQGWQGDVVRHIFESPLIRLMKEYGYRDVYLDGGEASGVLPASSVVIHRYYDATDPPLGGGTVPTIEQAAIGLRELIYRVRDQVCRSDDERQAFRVYLVAHSMGGLVARCFLQNDAISTAADRALVDKAYTYATPHNGIEMAGINVPAALSLWDMNNFNRQQMANYLGLPADSQRVDTLAGKFPSERFFCLVGTNPRDYEVAMGLSSRLAGEMSDGLVRIRNATLEGSPRGFVHRSHSGHFGIVNSEDGYQNLVRFLFGDLRVIGVMEVENLPLPPAVQKAYDQGQQIRCSYYFEATVTPRGGMQYTLTERRKDMHSAVLRKFDEMFRPQQCGLECPRFPVLFSVFLDSSKSADSRTVFSIDLAVSPTVYEVDRKLWFDRQVPGENLFRDTVVIRARRRAGGWDLRYNMADDEHAQAVGSKVPSDSQGLYVPLRSRKGFSAKLRLAVSDWA